MKEIKFKGDIRFKLIFITSFCIILFMIIIPMITMKADINVSLLKKKLAEIMYIIPEYMIISRGEPPEYMYICILLSWL